MAELGLRLQEAMLFRPHMALDDVGCLRILWGTKGGRPRALPLPVSPTQRAVVEWAKTFAQTPAESMVPRGWRLERYRRRVYRLCARIGLTKRQQGATPHSLRHGALLRLYERLTGVAPPARGGDLVSHDPEADLAARILVALQAGHSRSSVSSAYLGPRRIRGQPVPPSPGLTPSGSSAAAADSGGNGDAREVSPPPRHT
jgi:integrase